MAAEPLCDIIIPIWNQPELTKHCLESVAHRTDFAIRMILVDNGSEAPTRELLERFRQGGSIPVEILRNEKNLGFIKAVNQGIRAGKAPWICLLNNDTAVTDGWLSEMIRVAESDPRIGLVNPSSNTLGSDPRNLSAGWVEMPVAIGFCLLARRSLFDRIGLLDEQFGMGNFDDDDLSFRVRQAGLKAVRALAAYVHHEEKASFKKLPGWEKAFDENRRRFEKKWGRRFRILWARPPGQATAELANEGHWICVVPTEDKGWRARALWKLLIKRKKPFDLVVSHDPAWSRWVRRLSFLHRARLLDNPTPKELLEQCQTLSRSPSWSAPKETQPLPASASLPLSVVILTKNEEERLPNCIESVRFADEILVVDDESTDRTEAVALQRGAKVLHRKMDLEGKHRNWAAQQAKHEWILSIDADERVTPELSAEIRALFERGPEFQIYSIPRRNFIGKRWLRHGGWYPSAQVKLYKRGAFRWEETTVHCRALSDQPWGSLKGDLLHYSYRDLGDFIGKLNRQTTLEANKWVRDGRKMTRGKALWRTVDRFCRSYFGKKGYKDGWLGFAAAVLGGLYQLVSYAKYWETKSASGRNGETANGRDLAPSLTRPLAHSNVRPSLAVVLMTKNEEKRLAHCLDQVKGWADEIVVIDDESADRTVEVARRYTPKVFIQRSNDNHDRQWNTGSEKCSSEWILHIDADEIVTPALKSAIDRALAPPNGVCAEARGDASSSAGLSAYDLMRLNFFLGHPMRHGGWRHKHRILFRRTKSRCTGQGIHVKLQVDGPVGFLDAEIEHYPFSSLSQFIDRQNHYSSVEAQVLLKEKGKLPWKEVRRQMVWRPPKLFWKMYMKQAGYRDGSTGFFFAALFVYFHHALWAKYWEKAESS